MKSMMVSESAGLPASGLFDAAINDVVLEIRQSAAELRYLEEVERITRAQRQLLEDQPTGGGTARRADRSSRSGVANVREKSGPMDDDIVLITEARRLEQARLNVLLGRPAYAPAEGVMVARATVRELLSQLEEAERLAALHRDELIPQSARAVETGRTRLSQGLGSTRDFVEALGSWYNLCLTGARAEADRVVLLARFEALTGRAQTSLPRPEPVSRRSAA